MAGLDVDLGIFFDGFGVGVVVVAVDVDVDAADRVDRAHEAEEVDVDDVVDRQAWAFFDDPQGSAWATLWSIGGVGTFRSRRRGFRTFRSRGPTSARSVPVGTKLQQQRRPERPGSSGQARALVGADDEDVLGLRRRWSSPGSARPCSLRRPLWERAGRRCCRGRAGCWSRSPRRRRRRSPAPRG